MGPCAACASGATIPRRREFRWRDYAAGGPTGSGDPGSAGFSSPDNLVFDKARNLWVVTDISSSRLNGANGSGYHKNNAMFLVPTSGPNRGIGFRFANGPVHCRSPGHASLPTRRRCSSTSSIRAINRHLVHRAGDLRPGDHLHELVARGQPHSAKLPPRRSPQPWRSRGSLLPEDGLRVTRKDGANDVRWSPSTAGMPCFAGASRRSTMGTPGPSTSTFWISSRSSISTAMEHRSMCRSRRPGFGCLPGPRSRPRWACSACARSIS